jgi:hypothetical protein
MYRCQGSTARCAAGVAAFAAISWPYSRLQETENGSAYNH